MVGNQSLQVRAEVAPYIIRAWCTSPTEKEADLGSPFESRLCLLNSFIDTIKVPQLCQNQGVGVWHGCSDSYSDHDTGLQTDSDVGSRSWSRNRSRSETRSHIAELELWSSLSRLRKWSEHLLSFIMQAEICE